MSDPIFLDAIECLKTIKQSTWTSTSVPESDSLREHIYQMALVCLAHPHLVASDYTKGIAMCLTLDVGKIASGEVTLQGGRHPGELEEQLGLEYLTSIMREKSPRMALQLSEARQEYQAGETRVAKLVRQVEAFELLRNAVACRKKGQQIMSDEEFDKLKDTVTDPWLLKETEQILSDDWDPVERIADPKAPILFVIGERYIDRSPICETLKDMLNLEIVSLDQLLRDEQNRPGSVFADFIKDSLDSSKLAPPSLTVMLLKNKIRDIRSRGKGILIDGFPQTVHQVIAFEREITNVYSTLYFEKDVGPPRLLETVQADDGTRLEYWLPIHKRTTVMLEYLAKNLYRRIKVFWPNKPEEPLFQDTVKEIVQQGRGET